MQTPATAPAVISATIRARLTRHTCLSTIHMPIVRAAISGKMISFSPDSSATATISRIIVRAKRYLFLFVGSANSRVSGGRMFIAVFFGNDCKGNHFRPNGTFFPQRRVALSRKMRFYRRIMLIFTIGKQQPYGLQRYHPSERSRRDDQQLSCRSGAAPGPEPV